MCGWRRLRQTSASLRNCIQVPTLNSFNTTKKTTVRTVTRLVGPGPAKNTLNLFNATFSGTLFEVGFVYVPRKMSAYPPIPTGSVSSHVMPERKREGGRTEASQQRRTRRRRMP